MKICASFWELFSGILWLSLISCDGIDVLLCEGEEETLTCEEDMLIEIAEAFYGYNYADNSSREMCDDFWNKNSPFRQLDDEVCHQNDSVAILSRLCTDKSECSVDASNEVFTDPCPGVTKYLKVEYDCRTDDMTIDTIEDDDKDEHENDDSNEFDDMTSSDTIADGDDDEDENDDSDEESDWESNDDVDDDHETVAGLSSATVSGIAFGSVALILLVVSTLVGGGYCLYLKKKKTNLHEGSSDSPHKSTDSYAEMNSQDKDAETVYNPVYQSSDD